MAVYSNNPFKCEIWGSNVEDYSHLEKKARELRIETLDLSLETGDAHLGGCFSEIEILVSLYGYVMKEEDTFILSKGHCCHPLYILLRQKGYNPKISVHPDIDPANGISCTTGSLGHGLPIGTGMAFARKIKKQKGRIYVLMGDCECYEGTLWEASNIARHYKLDNLVVIVDQNKLGALGKIDDTLGFGNLSETFRVFGYYVSEVDGHSFQELIPALRKQGYEKPRAVICHTVKGKGVSYMEGNPEWHARRVTPERIKQAYKELK